jgi:DNA-binding HxlR family transcriptional regulator
MDTTSPREPAVPYDGRMTESPLENALSRVGDRWALLVVDALASGGPRRFGELQSDVSGIATNTLSDRLRRLEKEGVITASRYSERPPRFSYALTGAGMDLASALRLLAGWGAGHAGNDEGAIRHNACGTPMEARWYCPTCHETVDEAHASDLRFV